MKSHQILNGSSTKNCSFKLSTRFPANRFELKIACLRNPSLEQAECSTKVSFYIRLFFIENARKRQTTKYTGSHNGHVFVHSEEL